MAPRSTTDEERTIAGDSLLYDLLRDQGRKLDALVAAIGDLNSRVAVIEQVVAGQGKQDDRLDRLEQRVNDLERQQLEAKTQARTLLAVLAGGAGLVGSALGEVVKRLMGGH